MHHSLRKSMTLVAFAVAFAVAAEDPQHAPPTSRPDVAVTGTPQDIRPPSAGDPSEVLPQPRLPPAVPMTEPYSDHVLIHSMLIELQGDVQQAFEDFGSLTGSTGWMKGRWLKGLYDSGRARWWGTNADEGQKHTVVELGALYENLKVGLRLFEKPVRVEVLSRPQVRTLLDHSATIQVGQHVATAYFIQTGPNTFEQREAPKSPVGVVIEFLPKAVPENPELIEIAPLKISTTTIDGREPLPGVRLDVGKPIIVTRSLDVSLTVGSGEPNAILMPGPPGKQAVLLFVARRIPEKSTAVSPKTTEDTAQKQPTTTPGRVSR